MDEWNDVQVRRKIAEDQAKCATPHKQLIGELLDSRIPKTEREHAAAREIEQLRYDAAKWQSLAEGFEKARNSAIGKSGILANANRYVWVRAMLSVEDIERLVNEQWPWCGTDPRKLAEIDATVDKFMKG